MSIYNSSYYTVLSIETDVNGNGIINIEYLMVSMREPAQTIFQIPAADWQTIEDKCKIDATYVSTWIVQTALGNYPPT